MSEQQPESAASRIFRAAIPGRPGTVTSTESVPAVLAPGRGWLELAVVLAAFTIVIPVLGLLAAVCSLRARRAGNPRWLAALLAGCWCCLLGCALFGLVSFP